MRKGNLKLIFLDIIEKTFDWKQTEIKHFWARQWEETKFESSYTMCNHRNRERQKQFVVKTVQQGTKPRGQLSYKKATK